MPLSITYFERVTKAAGQHRDITWTDLCDWIAHATPTAATKNDLPLIKLATFAGNYRNDANLQAISGIEGDYDGEKVQPSAAAALLMAKGVQAFIYTSPSHQPGSPRFRVLCPLSRPHTPNERRALVGRLNGVLGGICASESFTPSQAFYVGSVAGGHPVQCWRVEGRTLDTVEGLPIIAPPPQSDGHGKDRKPLGQGEQAANIAAAIGALNAIDPNDLDYHENRNVTFAFRQATSTLVDEATSRTMWDIWCATYNRPGEVDSEGDPKINNPAKNEKLWRSADNGTQLGWSHLHWKAYGKPPQATTADAMMLFSGATYQLPPGASATPLQPAQPQQLDGYEEVISTATGDNGKNTLIETVKLLHGNLPVSFDEFSQTVSAVRPLPWDKHSTYPRPWTDLDTIHCQLYTQAFFIRPGKETVHDAVAIIANRHRRHQVRDYLDALQWDGIQRLPQLAHKYFSAQDTAYARTVWTKFMIGAVARIIKPGCKMDNVIILEGPQGTMKSSAIAALAGEEWFNDALPDLHKPDAAIQLAGKWFTEVGEMSAVRRSDVETTKAFIARRVDRFRAPYDKIAADHPRQSVFVATTNDEHYLKDQTGNRRFWPLTCGTIDIDAIKTDRDQLWAESLTRYRNRERWWLDDDETKLAEIEQEERREVDPWDERIASHVAMLHGMPTTFAQICFVLSIPFERLNSTVNKRVAQCLKRSGYVRKQVRNGEHRTWQYAKE